MKFQIKGLNQNVSAGVIGIGIGMMVGIVALSVVILAVFIQKRRHRKAPGTPELEAGPDVDGTYPRKSAGPYPKISLTPVPPTTQQYEVQPCLSAPGSIGNSPLPRRSSFSGIAESIFKAGSEDEIKGQINFSLFYDKRSESLRVNVIQVVGLGVRAGNITVDPYVRVSLLPEEKEVKRTGIIRKSLDPTFNSTLIFKGYTQRQLTDMMLCLSIMDHNKMTRDMRMGEVQLQLSGVNLLKSPVYWKMLQKPTVEVNGEIMLSMNWQPETNNIKVVVVRARNLPTADITGSSDPYVKLWLMRNGERVEKKKTTVKCQCLDPVYNETFTFLCTPDQVNDTQINLVVMDFDRIGSNDEMGFLGIGSRVVGTGAKHWDEMIGSPGSHAVMWHHLTRRDE